MPTSRTQRGGVFERYGFAVSDHCTVAVLCFKRNQLEIAMKNFLIVLASVTLAACGADVTTTAATAAVIKKQELEQGQKTMEQAKQSINQSMDLMQQSAQRAGDAAEK